MGKQRSAAEIQREQRRRRGAKSALIAERSDEPNALFDGSAETQAARLGDGRLQSVQRCALAAEIGRVQGNRYLQTIVKSLADAPFAIRQRSPQNVLARDVVTDTERRVGQTNVGAQWPGLSRSAFSTIMGIIAPDPDHPERSIPRAEQQRVLDILAADLGLPVGSRVTVRLSDRIGSRDGQATPYVDPTPACSTASAEEHRRTIHSRGDIKAFIEVNPSAFDRRVPRHRMTKLYTTLMHEYTHFQQFVAEGLHDQIVFVRRNHAVLGDIEELQAARGGQEDVIEALQEIDAASAEIENARRTGLTISFDVRHVANYLWEHYQRYKSRRGADNVDADVAARVYDNIEEARRLLGQYLADPQHQEEVRRVYPQPRIRQWLLANCPEVRLGARYDPAAMRREIAAARARAGGRR